ncbi:Dissimilatory sulfite reductase, alpha subunit [Bathymodiolus thermophilus thioautotrophic gill symbiont]|jgi:sulfite reductase alpha subunit|uniref:Dissimilatory sulfite reductase alpha subunit n=1 Tax=Bathymodiolus thermophilus thioautotrophic gill symbiont TaxID=2360 RepID=A0A1J5TUG5_9GAMM|nr:dissimilatory-type sulfite reductase subunit alpha [Bathymodiolus thermophilus thioautotrophic gill symbiont]AYQ57423.1 dissimilatory sulfite reductase alpha subunit [Bathymodiolus thermophilus thioautotrophic gill symbiont]OIR24459.1 sulfite reductase, dissimilatory-type subunit alpha [Bathymodiolus thermophilus thioautotrophic gill symbiont]CAB5495287.1 Dissimilatory sulfite reductase, alpha subunit (EC [Bathymodiolus thermophilus thioautotrophic gill symbiont]CAB5504077.1 Dissimilatory su
MAKELYNTPNLDELENGPWPSFVTGLKRLAQDDHTGASMVRDVLATLETSYVTKKGYWKGGTVGVVGYGGGVIPRFNELKDENGEFKFKDAGEFHTLRIQPPAGMHYTSQLLRDMCDMFVDNGGSGLIAFHGQSGDIMLQGATEETTQTIFNKFNDYGFDMGGAGPAVRTGMSCVGAARCEMSNTNEQAALRTLVNAFLDDMHRPALPYKMKFKVSGCANDCMNSIERSDFSTIGTWRDDIKINQDAWKAMVADKGMDYVVDNITSRCPTQAMKVESDTSLTIDNKNCVKCMHCLNVTSPLTHKYVKDAAEGAILATGDDKGVTICMGGKRTLKIGDLFGTVVVPFMKLESEDDYEAIEELAGEVIDFFAENALEHERTGEMIERIGIVNFMEGIGLEVNPNMVDSPRYMSYVRMDKWDEEAVKWFENKAEANA